MPDIYFVLSTVGYQKSKVSSRRIFNFCRTVKKVGHEVRLYTLRRDTDVSDSYDYSFLDQLHYGRARRFPLLSFLYKYYGGRNIAKSSDSLLKKDGSFPSIGRMIQNMLRRRIFGGSMTLDSRSGNFVKASQRHFFRIISRDIRRTLPEIGIKGNKLILFTCAQPGLVHMVGARLKRRFPDIIWVADYRDAQRNVGGSGFDEVYAEKVDRIVCRDADLISSVSEMIMECVFQGIEHHPPLVVMYNGFGLDDITCRSLRKTTGKLIVSYLGTIYGSQDFTTILDAVKKNPDLYELHYAGVSWKNVDDLTAKTGTTNIVNHGFVTLEESHRIMANSDILVVLKKKWGFDKGRPYAKFFEYLLYNIPILIIGDRDPETNALAKDLGGVTVVPYTVESVSEALSTIGRRVVTRNQEAMQQLEWPVMFNRLETAIAELIR